MASNKTKTIGVRVSDELHEKLTRITEKTNLPMGHLVTESLEAASSIILAEPDKPREITPQFLSVTRVNYYWKDLKAQDLTIRIEGEKNAPTK
tara:strand:+ start:2040 stop:2318 length:279 start_codon:yes stop_codon:yes gene_type:complete